MSKSMTLFIAIMLLSAMLLHAKVPQLINYQGALNDADNNPVTAQNLSGMFDTPFLSPATKMSADEFLNVSLVGRWAAGACQAVEVVGNLVYYGNGANLEIMDFTDKSNPVALGNILLPGPVKDIAVSGNFAYVANEFNGLRIIDISDPNQPHETAFVNCEDLAFGVAVSGSYVYLANRWAGLRVIDVSDPTQPQEVGYFTGNAVFNVAIHDTYAYIANWTYGLRILDISNPSQPQEIGHYKTAGYAHDVTVDDTYAYVADYYDGLRIIDISNPNQPTEVSYVDTDDIALSVHLDGNHVYIADKASGLRIIDISDVWQPQEIGYYDTQGNAYDVTVSGNYAYVADFDAGLCVINVSNPVQPLKTKSINMGGPAHHVVVNDSYMYVANRGAGLWIVDVSNPEEPYAVGNFDSDGDVLGVAVQNNYAYTAEGYTGFRVLDISNPAQPQQVGYLDTGGWAVRIIIKDNYAYLADLGDGLRIIDISNPAQPQEIGYFDTDGRARGIDLHGTLIYIADYDNGRLQIIDIANPMQPLELGHIDSKGIAMDVTVVGKYAYLADTAEGLRVIDISNPAKPAEISYCETPGDAYYVEIKGNYAYVACFAAGMRVIDISDPFQPHEVGFYDTGSYAHSLAFCDDYICVADADDGIYILKNDLFFRILSISDFPNDQGKQARITWEKSHLDGGGTNYQLTHYCLWRKVNLPTSNSNFTQPDTDIINVASRREMLNIANQATNDAYYRIPNTENSMSELWDFVVRVEAHHFEQYSYVAPTEADSTKDGIFWSTFFVSAHTPDPDVFFDSPPDSGYSIDNLVPAAPQNVAVSEHYSGSNRNLLISWTPNSEDDFSYYAVYRSTQTDFTPTPDLLFQTTTDTFIIDQSVLSNPVIYYKISAFDFAGNESDFSAETSFRFFSSLTLQQKQGWNMLSFNIMPDDPNVIAVFKPIVDQLVILKNSKGQTYIPKYNINGIGDINCQEGYQAYFSETTSLQIIGYAIVPGTPIDLPAGWSMISYLPTTPIDAVTALASISGQLVIAKNNAGQSYIPAYSINTIGEMQVGQGYQVYLNAPGTLIYPAASLTANEVALLKSTEKASVKHFQFTSVTGENATILLPLTIEPQYSDGDLIETGDEIGIFNSSGICCGAAVWEGCHTAITVWGDDSQTELVEGFISSEALQFRLWRKTTDKEYQVNVEYAENQRAVYRANGFSVLSKFEALTTTDVAGEEQAAIPTEFRLLQNYPNPFNPSTVIRYQLPDEKPVRITVYNSMGQQIRQLISEMKSAGYHEIEWDGTDDNNRIVPSGIYFYRIDFGESYRLKKCLLLK